MSSLQNSLALVGGLTLVGVVLYNLWTARQNAPRQASPDSAVTGTDPTLDASADPKGPHDPGFLDDALATLPVPEKKPPLDALIDVIAAIEVDNQVSGDAALAALPTTRRVGTKPFAVEGLNDTTGEWEIPIAGRRYHAFQAGIHLANRVGALNEIEYSVFVIKAQACADAINGSPEFPDMLEEVARARELDQFASEHDAQLSFTVVATAAAWSPGYIHQHAARWGFVAGVIPGRMVLAAPVQGLPPLVVASAYAADHGDRAAAGTDPRPRHGLSLPGENAGTADLHLASHAAHHHLTHRGGCDMAAAVRQPLWPDQPDRQLALGRACRCAVDDQPHPRLPGHHLLRDLAVDALHVPHPSRRPLQRR